MREIKFRGKRLDNEKWVYGYHYQQVNYKDDESPINHSYITGYEINKYGAIMLTGTHIVHYKSVGQYTGLKDINGKEIYTGDILKDRNYPMLVCFGEFSVFENTMKILGYYVEYAQKEELEILDLKMTMKFPLFEEACKDFEVVGNVYENADLLD